MVVCRHTYPASCSMMSVNIGGGIVRNYDLNIWDRWSYETDGEVTGGWVINAYPLVEQPDGTLMQDYTEDKQLTLHLREHDVEFLGLNGEEPDFWSDAQYLLEQPDVPRRVRIWLEKVVGGVFDGNASVA